jgi:hypothetical protein
MLINSLEKLDKCTSKHCHTAASVWINDSTAIILTRRGCISGTPTITTDASASRYLRRSYCCILMARSFMLKPIRLFAHYYQNSSSNATPLFQTVSYQIQPARPFVWESLIATQFLKPHDYFAGWQPSIRTCFATWPWRRIRGRIEFDMDRSWASNYLRRCHVQYCRSDSLCILTVFLVDTR